MVSSCACYENALEHVKNTTTNDNSDEEARQELLRRLGNVRNELGLKYMFWSQEEYTKHSQESTKPQNTDKEMPTDVSIENENTKDSTDEPLYLKLAMKSYDCLIRGIKAFGLVQDNVNLAFLYCNMGRFMRFRAHLVTPNDR